MSNFIEFKLKINEQIAIISESNMFYVDIDKDKLWELYLGSFPTGSNPIYKERTEHDCQCCKKFIRDAGSAVSIVDNKLVSVWDINIGGIYQVVTDELSKFVKQHKIENAFLHRENDLGTDYNHQQLEGGDIKKWDHFHYHLSDRFVEKGILRGSKLSEIRSGKDVFKRSLDEISLDSIEIVLELIKQNSVYRLAENESIIERFFAHKIQHGKLDPDSLENYCWNISVKLGGASKVRNTAVGTLLVDLSNGMDINEAVGRYEAKVAPTNYKRPTALITKSMIFNAEKQVEELGIKESLTRRHAIASDITVNNVLFADRAAKKSMNVFDELASEVPDNISKLKKVEEVGIETFVNDILPKAGGIELMLENRHANNLVSLIAPIHPEAKHIFKWDNNFSWAYEGEVADSMKERVAKAGGNVQGVLRFSIQWNDGDDNQNDFDAHCIEPNGNLIYHQNKGNTHISSGILDVDIVNPRESVAVENITWSYIDKMQSGHYTFLVHNYSHNGGETGFTAEIEYDGNIYSYAYNKELRQSQKVTVAKITFSKEGGIKFVESLPSMQSSKSIWNIATQKFHRVSMVMNSPNHWDGNKTGNKHLFFILDGCRNDKKARGFFNEFLNNDLTGHRKVFEVLGSKMKADLSDNQLSGIGFSSTQKNHVFCKVLGSFSRTIKIIF